MYDQVQKWYNGYWFGKRIIYNPWSIINFLGSEEKEFKPYWINTSENKIVESLLSKGGEELKEELEVRIRGETVDTAAAAALEQIEKKKYETELIERGINNIKKLAVIFSGNDVYVKEKEKDSM